MTYSLPNYNIKNIPFKECINPKTNTFKSKNELRVILKTKNVYYKYSEN